MPSPYSRLTATRRWLKLSITLCTLAGLACIIAVLILGDRVFEHMMPYLIAGAAFMLLAAVVSGLVALFFKIEANSHRIHELLIDVKATQDKQTEALGVLRDNSQISDAAKSITHRDLERDALRKAIREDILREDWEAAYSLIEEMENRFGYRVEAYNYRQEVDEFRARVIEDRLQASLGHARKLLNNLEWDQAEAETERLLKLAPKDARVAEVIEQLRLKKSEFKAQLMEQWQQAVDAKDLDRSIELLKEIDPYLTREEAEKLQDSARSVFKAKLLDLGVRFRSAVREKRWDDAISIGEQIRNEYPNSLMAKEVGESMEALSTKASQSTSNPAN